MGWIVDKKKVLSNSCLNIVGILKQCRSKGFTSAVKGCDLGHLILVNISNETRRKVNHTISLANLISNLEIIGYSPDKVKKEVYDLYSNGNERKTFGHILSIDNDDKVISDPESIPNSAQLSINYRAIELIEKITCSLTFISRSLYVENEYDWKF